MKKTSLLMSKKGVFYLLLSSIFIALMIVVFLAYKEYSYTDKQKVFETRIRTINDFIRSIDTDSKRVIYISGYRSLIAMEDYVAKSGQYLNDSEELFRLAFYNGTVNGTQVEVLKDATYSDYLTRLRIIAGMIGLDIDISVPNITGINLYQESPWQVIINVTVQINLTDQKGLARWNFNKTYSANVSLISIRDPVYSVATHGRVPNPIRISDITDFITGNKDTTNLLYHVVNMSYTNNTLAPSFLMRLEGNFSSSFCCGIESFAYIPELDAQGVVYDASRSIIDYILFSNDTNITISYSNVTCYVQNITGTYGWFKIDVNHTGLPWPDYIEDLNYTTCP